MKKLIALIAIVILTSCEDCDSVIYQVWSIQPNKKTGICTYEVRPRAACNYWFHPTIQKHFMDSCGRYMMSESILKDSLKARYGI